MDKKYDNLWPDLKIESFETEEIKEILNAQCDYIKENSGELICAKLVEMRYFQSPIKSALLGLAKTQLIFQDELKSNDFETLNKEDINDVIKETVYAFTIFNEKYKFTAFYVTLNQYFPVKVEPDFDIAEELGFKDKDVNNVEEFIATITSILNSNKMKFILKRLQTIFLQQSESTQLLDKPKG